MSKELALDDKKSVKQSRLDDASKMPEKQRPTGPSSGAAEVLNLQKRVGNRAVQRLIAQRSGDGSFELDDSTAGRINRSRGGGQSLDSAIQKQMGETMGQDFSGVRVHTSSEADQLSQDLNAKAFTTGQDIFFKQGEYTPGSSSGQELIAHELTHVVQQSSGAVGGSGGRMTVNPPNDAFEQEADSIAHQAVHGDATNQAAGGGVQRQELPEEEELQTKADDAVQRQELPEEEELQTKADDAVQRQELPEEEELQTKADDGVQRQELPEEEELQTKADGGVQRQELPEEEELQTKADDAVQRHADEQDTPL